MSNLPECMKICFSVLSDTTDEIAMEIQKETGFCGALPYLRKAVSLFSLWCSIRVQSCFLAFENLTELCSFLDKVGRFLQINANRGSKVQQKIHSDTRRVSQHWMGFIFWFCT